MEAEKHVRMFCNNSPVEKTRVYIRARILGIEKKRVWLKIYIVELQSVGLSIWLDDLCMKVVRLKD